MIARKLPPIKWRHEAYTCYLESGGKLNKAAQLFGERLDYKCMARPEGFIKRWAQAGKEMRPWDKIAPGRGRHRLLNEADEANAVKALVTGFKQRGSNQRKQFTSIGQACMKSPVLQEIQRRTGATNRTMLNSMKRSSKTLCRRTEDLHQPLSDSQRNKRFLASRKLIQKNRHYFRRTIWIDAAKFWVDVESKQVWTDGSVPKDVLRLPDPRAKGKRGNVVCLAYYAAVNEELGPVHIKLTSGTKGYTKLKTFTVSSQAVTHAPTFLHKFPHLLRG